MKSKQPVMRLKFTVAYKDFSYNVKAERRIEKKEIVGKYLTKNFFLKISTPIGVLNTEYWPLQKQKFKPALEPGFEKLLAEYIDSKDHLKVRKGEDHYDFTVNNGKLDYKIKADRIYFVNAYKQLVPSFNWNLVINTPEGRISTGFYSEDDNSFDVELPPQVAKQIIDFLF